MIGVIADDFTGATDVAAAFRRERLRTEVRFGVPVEVEAGDDVDAVVVALKSRMAQPAEAVAATLDALSWLKQRGATHFYIKYCSTFDSTPTGNIGPVLDAVSEELGVTRVVQTPSAPDHGRTQYMGYLFVGPSPLSESHMRNHPLTPMTDSSLMRLLSPQTKYRVGILPHTKVAQGAPAVRHAALEAETSGVRYILADAIDTHDLTVLGAAFVDEPLCAGSAGLAAALAAAVAAADNASHGTKDLIDPALPAGRLAILSGSCSARTLEQVTRFKQAGKPSFFFDVASPVAAADLANDALAWYDRLDDTASEATLFYSSVGSEQLALIQQRLGVPGSAEKAEAVLGAVAAGLVKRGVARLVSAGGETSGAVVGALGLTGGIVGTEASFGVPWVLTPTVALLLKSGNFGEPELFLDVATANENVGS